MVTPQITGYKYALLVFLSGGPEGLSASIGPATALSNGTLIAYKGSTVTFNCSGTAYPSVQLSWAFSGASFSNDSLVSTSGSFLKFRMEDIQPSAQGVYSCRAQNTLTHQTLNKSTELLVYCKYHEWITQNALWQL